MDRMLESSTDFINNVDLDNAVYEGRGLEMLEQFDKQGMDAIFGNKTKGALPIGELYDNLNSLNATPAQPVKIKNSIGSKENKKYF